jgi:hypothetical protein
MVAAVVRMDTGPADYNYAFVGYDFVFVINLTFRQFEDVQFGVGSTDLYQGLLTGGHTNDPDFGGSGPQPLSQLGALQIYTTLVPEGMDGAAVSFTYNGRIISASAVDFQNGDIVYVNSNQAPLAESASITTNEDEIFVGQLNAVDNDADSLTYTIVSQGALGTASIGDPSKPGFTFTPNENANGVDSFTFKVNDGTVDSAIATVSVSIDAVNDAPSFLKGTNQVVVEDSGPQNIPAWATALSSGPANEAGQTLGFILSNDNTALFAAQPEINVNGDLSYTPSPNVNGSAMVTVRVSDNGGTANGGVDTSTPQSFTITVNALNDAPTFISAATLPAVEEDTINPDGEIINNLLSASFSDQDNDAFAGIAVSSDASSSGDEGTWQYSTDGATWFSVGPVSDSSALLLSSATKLRFLPVGDYNGTPGGLTVFAVDGSNPTAFTTGAATYVFDTTADDGSSKVSASGVLLEAQVNAVNDIPVNTVLPVISGETQVGKSLSATAGTWSDVDGDTPSFSYQWRSDGMVISGARQSSFTPTVNEAHTVLTVAVSADDGHGGISTAVSAGTALDNTAPANNVLPVISGTNTVGGALSATAGTWTDADGDIPTYSYQWQADGNVIDSATNSSYTLTSDQAHAAITVTVTADDGNGGSVAATSAATPVDNTAPANSVLPVISGTNTVGGALSATAGTWTDADGDIPTYSYQWQADGIAVDGATHSSFTVTTSEAHATITVAVTANDGNGDTVTVTSAGKTIANIAPAFDGVPAISGTAATGNTLSLTSAGTHDSDGDTVILRYQWMADNVNIPGADSATYVIAASETHKIITCSVTADDGNGGIAGPVTTAGVPVVNSQPVFYGKPSISGVTMVGHILSLDNTGTNDPDEDTVTLSYQWQRDGMNINNATSSSFTLTSEDAHAWISCIVSGDDGFGGTVGPISTSSVLVGNTPPYFTATPSITGTAMVGNTLGLINTDIDDADQDIVNLSYQWQRDGVNIEGAKSSTYQLTTAEAHAVITCTVAASDGKGGTAGPVTAAGVMTDNTAPEFTGIPFITGIAKMGQTLSLADIDTRDIDGDTVTMSYQWKSGGVNIPEATSHTYQLTRDEAGKNIFCTITADDGNGGVTTLDAAGVNVEMTFPWPLFMPAILSPIR